MKTVIAKVKVNRIEITGSEQEKVGTVHMTAVHGTEDPTSENSQFFKWTPAASFSLGTLNPEALKLFEVGKQYYVEFKQAQEAN